MRLGSGWTPEIRRDLRRGTSETDSGSGVVGAFSASVSSTLSLTKWKSNCLTLTLSSLGSEGRAKGMFKLN